MRLKTKIAIVALSTALALCAIIGGFISRSGEVVARGSQYVQVRIFDEVLDHIIRDYVDQPDLEKVRIGSLRGLAEGLDPYSAYLTPEQVSQYDPEPNRAGTGLILSRVNGYAYIVAALKGSPAEAAGLRDGDFIEYINNIPTREMSLYEVEQLLSGQPGTSVKLRIFRQGRSMTATVNLARIAQPAIEARLEEPGLGYIKVTSLAEGKAAEIKTRLSELLAKGAQRIILDLRGAANGTLQEGIAAANFFVGSGTLARIIGKQGKEISSYMADPNKVVFSGPLAVIIDRSTAGPAEIIAAAVRDQKRGEVIGERSFGAGSKQQLFPLSDGGALLITVAKYAPASGKPFMEEPVSPTVKVERPLEAEIIIPDSEEEEESQEPPAIQPKAEPTQPAEDLQLKKAIEILKQLPIRRAGLNKYSKPLRIEQGRQLAM
jgi:carboxyl-terminal processing protease